MRFQRHRGAQAGDALEANVDRVRNQSSDEEKDAEAEAERKIVDGHDQTCSTEMPLASSSSVSIATWLPAASKAGAATLTGIASLMCQTTTGAPASSQRLIAIARAAGGSAVSQSMRNVFPAVVPFFSVTVAWLSLGTRATISPCHRLKPWR